MQLDVLFAMSTVCDFITNICIIDSLTISTLLQLFEIVSNFMVRWTMRLLAAKGLMLLNAHSRSFNTAVF